jgi:hypothetical protein
VTPVLTIANASERVQLVHAPETDTPYGIEIDDGAAPHATAYWYARKRALIEALQRHTARLALEALRGAEAPASPQGSADSRPSTEPEGSPES